MAPASHDPDALIQAVCNADQSILGPITELNAAETATVAAGLEVLPEPVRLACFHILQSWSTLGPAERVAGLLALSTALASTADWSKPA